MQTPTMHTPPQNQGQTVERSYGWIDGSLYCRVTDHSDRSIQWLVADESEAADAREDVWAAPPEIRTWYAYRLHCACGSCDATRPAPGEDGGGDADGEWQDVEGETYCPDCVDYSCDADGTVYCATHDVPDIDWGHIQTGASGGGRPNWREGVDAEGRRWITEDRGGWTCPRPVEDVCPICGDSMPKQAQARRVAYNGTVVCGRASCEDRAGE